MSLTPLLSPPSPFPLLLAPAWCHGGAQLEAQAQRVLRALQVWRGYQVAAPRPLRLPDGEVWSIYAFSSKSVEHLCLSSGSSPFSRLLLSSCPLTLNGPSSSPRSLWHCLAVRASRPGSHPRVFSMKVRNKPHGASDKETRKNKI